MSAAVNVYDDELPVSDDWQAAHEGETWTIRFVVTLDELIEVPGIEEMNSLCDARTGVHLYDLSYAIGQPGEDDDLGEWALIIEATGTVDPV